MEPSLCSDGNRSGQAQSNAAGAASMEPSLCSDGNARCVPEATGRCGSFNGAVALQRRKLLGRSASWPQPDKLQWSRRSAATETDGDNREPGEALWASMEPSLCSDGNKRGRGEERRQRWLQWSRRSAATETVYHHQREYQGVQLQWSRRSAATETALGVGVAFGTWLLQWSRRSAATETRFIVSPDGIAACRLQWSRRSAATETVARLAIGPRHSALQWSRRSAATETMPRALVFSVPLVPASMEPSLCSDGNAAAAPVGAPVGAVLQWSRRSAATETGGSAVLTGAKLVGLQWSRRSAATETRPIPRRSSCRRCASMEPSLCSDGNRATGSSTGARVAPASMEPSLCSDGNHTSKP